ncbi:MAG: hypothetical protein V4580_11485 [Bacteroidota bacterium]
MRKLIFLLGSSLIISSSLNAQLKRAEFRDGTSVQYQVFDNTADKAKKGLIRIGFGAMGLGYQYVNPTKFEVSGGFSMFSGGYANLLYSFYSYKREKKINLTVKEVSGYRTSKRYYIKGEKSVTSNFIGLHVGARYFNEQIYLISPLRLVTNVLLEKKMFPYTGTAVMGGIGKFKTSRMEYSVNGEGRSYTNKTGIYLDVMYYASLKYDLYNPLSDAIEPYDDYSKIGFLFLMETSSTSTNKEGKHGWGTAFQFGIGKGPAGLIGLIGIGLAF